MAETKFVPVVTLNLSCSDCRKFKHQDVTPTIVPNEKGDAVRVHYICPACGIDLVRPRDYALRTDDRR